MPAAWTYPWSMVRGDEKSMRRDIVQSGIDHLSIAAHYHSVQSLQPRTSNTLFESFEGGCHFSPDTELYESTAIDPPVVTPTTFNQATNAAQEAGLETSAWVVCNHNTKLGANYPKLQTESVFGDSHAHSLCPSNSEVLSYLETLVVDIASRDVDEIQFESIGYPSAFHTHGSTFGHAKNHAVTAPHEQVLLSQCFCDACRDRLSDKGIDVDNAANIVRDLTEPVLKNASESLPPLSVLCERYPVLERIFSARADVITSLMERLADASGETTVTYLASETLGDDLGDLWPSGVVPERIAPYVDQIVALCYTNNLEDVHQRVSEFAEHTPMTIKAGITLDPLVISSKDQFSSVIDSALEGGADDYQVYNHALMTREHFDWVSSYENT